MLNLCFFYYLMLTTWMIVMMLAEVHSLRLCERPEQMHLSNIFLFSKVNINIHPLLLTDFPFYSSIAFQYLTWHEVCLRGPYLFPICNYICFPRIQFVFLFIPLISNPYPYPILAHTNISFPYQTISVAVSMPMTEKQIWIW